MSSKTPLFLCILAVLAAATLGYSARAEKLELPYQPAKGDTVVYNMKAITTARDAGGFVLSTETTGTLELKVVDVILDGDKISSVTIEIAQKNAVLKAVSGDQPAAAAEGEAPAPNQKVVNLPDRTVTFVTDGLGSIRDGASGLEKQIVQAVNTLYSEIGKDARITAGKEYKHKVVVPCLNDAIPTEVVYVIAGKGSVNGLECIHIDSWSNASKTMKKGPVRNVTVAWKGNSSYAHKAGHFARISVAGEVKAELEDKTTASAEFSLVLDTAPKRAAAPAAPLFGGFSAPSLPMFVGLAFVIGLAALSMKVRRQTLRKAFACGLAVALMIAGMPINRAEAASPSAFIEFSEMVRQMMFTSAGMSTAGAAGLCMNGTKAASLGVAYSAAPWWSMPDALLVAAEVTPEFVQPVPMADAAEEVAGAAAVKTSAGAFSATNMLIGGGGLLAIGGGIAVATSGGSSTGGAAAPPAPPRDCGTAAILTDVTTNVDTITITFAPAFGPEGDRVKITFNDVVKYADLTLVGNTNMIVNLDSGKNCLKIEYLAGGPDSAANVMVVFSVVTVGDDVQFIDIPPAGEAKCTVNR